MRWYPLAREECKALLSSKGVWLLALALLLWTYRPSYDTWDGLGPDMTIGFVQFGAGLLLPLAAVVLGYQAIVGDRTSGSLTFVLGLPLTRGEILAGKLVGRTAGIAIPAFLSFVVVTVLGAVQYGFFSPLRYLAVLAVTLVYVTVLVSIAVSVSALVERTTTAAATLFVGLILIFELAWQFLSVTLYSRLTGVPVDPSNPPAEGGLFLLARLSPSGAYNTVTNWILDVGNSADFHNSVLQERQPNVNTNVLVVETTFDPGTVPPYLHEAGGLLVLSAWGLVPLAIAYYRFNRGDLA